MAYKGLYDEFGTKKPEIFSVKNNSLPVIRYGQTAANPAFPSVGSVPTYGEFAAAKNAEAGALYTPTAEAAPTYGEVSFIDSLPASSEPIAAYSQNAPEVTPGRAIEEIRKASYADAEAARQRAVVDAESRRILGQPTYGALGERLAGAGLASSGYGEYLASSAYAQSRAQAQAAKGAEVAAKREADRVYYADMAAAEQSAKAQFAQLLDVAKSGTYTVDEILGMAKKYGVSDEADLAQLSAAAIESGEKKSNAAYLSLLDAAKSGNYTADEIRSIAEKQGVTNVADIDALAAAAGEAKTEAEKKDLPGTITANTTDEEIDKMIAAGKLSQDNRESAVETRRNAAEDEIEIYINSGNIAGADNAVEKYYESGVLTSDDRQSYYLDRYIDKIEKEVSGQGSVESMEKELLKAKNEGKLSQSDYDAAMKYLYSQLGRELAGGNYGVKQAAYEGLDKAITGGKYNRQRLEITFNGKKYTVNAETNIFETVETEKRRAKALETILGRSPYVGDIVSYNGKVYYYYGGAANQWYEIKNNEFVSAVKEYEAVTPGASKPEHGSSSSGRR